MHKLMQCRETRLGCMQPQKWAFNVGNLSMDGDAAKSCKLLVARCSCPLQVAVAASLNLGHCFFLLTIYTYIYIYLSIHI